MKKRGTGGGNTVGELVYEATIDLKDVRDNISGDGCTDNYNHIPLHELDLPVPSSNI